MFFAVFYTGVCVDIGHFFLSAWQYKTSIATVALLKLFPVVMYFRAREVTFWHYGHVNRSFYLLTFTYLLCMFYDFTLPCADVVSLEEPHRSWWLTILTALFSGYIVLIMPREGALRDDAVWRLSRTSRLSREQRGLGRLKLAQR